MLRTKSVRRAGGPHSHPQTRSQRRCAASNVIPPKGSRWMADQPTDYHGLPPPRSTLRDSSARVLVWCKACRHQGDAPLQQLCGPSSRAEFLFYAGVVISPEVQQRPEPPEGQTY